jgi:hypothetical protein
MNYKGVEVCVEQASEREDVWIWRFEVDHEVRTGKIRTKLKPMVIRRAQQAIDRELKKRSVPSGTRHGRSYQSPTGKQGGSALNVALYKAGSNYNSGGSCEMASVEQCRAYAADY